MIKNTIISKTTVIYLLICCLAISRRAEGQAMQSFNLNQVHLLKSPFLDAEQTDLNYMLKLSPDRLLAPFLREAGLKIKAESYGNWENTGLDGHTAGHYLTALAQMYASTGNLECKRRLDYMVSELVRCQAKNGNGYVGGVPDGNKMWANLKTGDFALFNKKWVPWYNLHKLLAGLRDGYLLAGNSQAKVVFIKLIDWTNQETAGLSDSQMQQMLNTEQGGMDEVCADAEAITGDKKYLLLAQRFCHRAILLPLEQRQDKLNGLHANTQIPKVIGFERIAELSHDTTYATAADFFWQTVVQNRSISIGGNSVREHFNPADNFGSMIESEQGPETCNSYNMLKLTKMLFLNSQGALYIDYYERLLYNHILSSQHPGAGGFVYFTPIHPQHYRVYSTAGNSFWCCVGTGMENHGKYGELIFTHVNNSLFVNLFIPSVLNWKEKGIHVTQNTKFPESEQSNIKLALTKPSRFSLFLRRPSWVTEGYRVSVNGHPIEPGTASKTYVQINRVWKNGDEVTVALPMKNYVEYLPDHSQWVSFLHGPLVLAAPTDTTDLKGLFAGDNRWGHIASGAMDNLSSSPMLASNDHDVSTYMKAAAGSTLNYRISDLIVQQNFKNLNLIPFYKVHDTRYMLYWPIAKTDSVDEREAELQAMDERYLKFASRTIDQVFPGEQQPENDHLFASEGSESGIFKNIHWRRATGYFSYRMRITPQVKHLLVTYYGQENGPGFDIFLDNFKLAHVEMNGPAESKFTDVDYPVPADAIAGKRNVVIKFVAANGNKTASIYNIRLLK